MELENDGSHIASVNMIIVSSFTTGGFLSYGHFSCLLWLWLLSYNSSVLLSRCIYSGLVQDVMDVPFQFSGAQ